MPPAQSPPNTAPRTDPPFTVHTEAVPALVDRAARVPEAAELVVTPEQLHRRNLRDRLRRADAPQSAFRFVQPVDVARQVAGAANAPTERLDRVDRLYHLDGALDDARDRDAEWWRSLAVSMGADLTAAVEAVEHLRNEVETTTGFHPDRLATLRERARELGAPDRDDALARVDAAVELQRALARRVEVAPTGDAVTRGATRKLAAHGQSLWAEAYPNVERVTVAGVSTVGATLADLLAVLSRRTDATVGLHLRHATGDRLADRLGQLSAIDAPGSTVVDA
ncbi:hypothetical protein [Halobaculum marinum]|uniref:Uncharacterized protein n=1 Tax=Halobaculum marinum TaxID=3031996 RepID=A0ABD5WQK1_9EURY|nr:hypothetical protein [Halobaculum sp. DT55]